MLKHKFSMAFAGVALIVMLVGAIFEPAAAVMADGAIAFIGQADIAITMPMLIGVPKIFMEGANDKGSGAAVKGKDDLSPKEEFRQIASELKDKVSDFKKGLLTEAEYKERAEKMNARMDDLEFSLKAQKKKPVDGEKAAKEHNEAFKKALYQFASGGDRKSLNSQNVQDSIGLKSGYHSMLEKKSDNFVRFDQASGGALLLPEELSATIRRNAVERNAITRLVTNTTTSSHRKVIPIRVSTPGIYWVEEEGTTSKGKITYRKVALVPKKAAARYGMSIEQEQDTAYDLENEIRDAYEEDFDVSLGTAVTSGDGNGKPTGLIGRCKSFASAGLTITPKMLIDMQESLLEAYQSNANWLFTRKTRAHIRTIVLSDNAYEYAWEPDFTRRSPSLLFGAPVNIAREGDMAGEFDGAFSAGQVPVLYGDFARGYELTMRSDMYMIDDPYTESAEWIRNLNIMSRVDGHPTQADKSLVELNITAP